MNKNVLKKILCATICTLLIPTVFSLGGCASQTRDDFTMRGVVLGISDKIEIDVTEGEYAEGIYHIIYSSAVFLNAKGERVSVSDLSVGDKIEVTYGGQVMMSYPPQVAATVIRILGE